MLCAGIRNQTQSVNVTRNINIVSLVSVRSGSCLQLPLLTLSIPRDSVYSLALLTSRDSEETPLRFLGRGTPPSDTSGSLLWCSRCQEGTVWS